MIISELMNMAEELATKMDIAIADAMQIICSIHQTKVIEREFSELRKTLQDGVESLLETHQLTLLN